MPHDHGYECHLLWRGSTGLGYAGYDRTHRVRLPPAAEELTLSSDAVFLGSIELANPEQLLLAAASSCQLLSFLAVAARAGADVVSYEDDAEAVMPAGSRPVRITRIVLRPHISVAPGCSREQVIAMVATGHEQCYVANSLTTEVVIEPTVTVLEAASAPQETR